MNTNKVQNRVYVSDRTLNRTIKRPNNYSAMSVPSNNISFKGSSGEAGKKIWFYLRRLGDQMKDITEIKNALIAAIGTGIIAPAIILVSPGKGDKEDKRKKATQAIRQPLSAGLQLGFQVPATILINMGIDYLNYEEKIKLFRDDKIGDLIPTEKYLSKKATKKEISNLEAKFEEIVNGKSLKQELEEKIKSDYKEVGLEISDEELAKRVSKEKEGFLRKKIAQTKIKELKAKKFDELIKNSKFVDSIKEIDLVTEDYQLLAEHKNKAELARMEKEANLSFFDKVLREMGFETKKVEELKNRQKKFKKEEGLKLLRKDKPEIFKDRAEKLKSFIESHQKEAEKNFGNKKFWISLGVNLFMITASCFALNWMHPRVNKMFEDKKAEKENSLQKAEVK